MAKSKNRTIKAGSGAAATKAREVILLELTWSKPITFNTACHDLRALLVGIEILATDGAWHHDRHSAIHGFAVFNKPRPTGCSLTLECSKAEVRACIDRGEGLWLSLGGKPFAKPVKLRASRDVSDLTLSAYQRGGESKYICTGDEVF